MANNLRRVTSQKSEYLNECCPLNLLRECCMILRINQSSFEVFTTLTKGDMTPCSLVEIRQRVGGPYCYSLQSEAVRCSVTAIILYQATRDHIPEDGYLKQRVFH
jgi:hypothetical protein